MLFVLYSQVRRSTAKMWGEKELHPLRDYALLMRLASILAQDIGELVGSSLGKNDKPAA